MTMEPTPTLDPLLDIKVVAKTLSRSRASIYRDIKAETFPKPLKIGGVGQVAYFAGPQFH